MAFIFTLLVVLFISFLFVLVTFSGLPPILAGQRWKVPGIGTVTILKSLSSSEKITSGPGKGSNVVYRTENGLVGYCLKPDIYSKGVLLPYDPYATLEAFEAFENIGEKNDLYDYAEPLILSEPKKKTSYEPGIKVTIEGYSDRVKNNVMDAEIIYPEKFKKLYLKDKLAKK